MMMSGLIQRIARDRRGSFAIETAFVAPLLILLTLGIVEIGTMVARQHELQSAANETEIIILATNQGAETDVDTIKAIVRESVGLADSEVTISQIYRCGTNDALVSAVSSVAPLGGAITSIIPCGLDEPVSSYIVLDITEVYEPKWNYLGIGNPITFSVERRIQVS